MNAFTGSTAGLVFTTLSKITESLTLFDGQKLLRKQRIGVCGLTQKGLRLFAVEVVE